VASDTIYCVTTPVRTHLSCSFLSHRKGVGRRGRGDQTTHSQATNDPGIAVPYITTAPVLVFIARNSAYYRLLAKFNIHIKFYLKIVFSFCVLFFYGYQISVIYFPHIFPDNKYTYTHIPPPPNPVPYQKYIQFFTKRPPCYSSVTVQSRCSWLKPIKPSWTSESRTSESRTVESRTSESILNIKRLYVFNNLWNTSSKNIK
jgi:hypothetical protein